jgi:hypothetical protein
MEQTAEMIPEVRCRLRDLNTKAYYLLVALASFMAEVTRAPVR